MSGKCPCPLQCSACNACVHLYSCTRLDASIHSTVCKHVHYIHMSITNDDQVKVNNKNEELTTNTEVQQQSKNGGDTDAQDETKIEEEGENCNKTEAIILDKIENNGGNNVECMYEAMDTANAGSNSTEDNEEMNEVGNQMDSGSMKNTETMSSDTMPDFNTHQYFTHVLQVNQTTNLIRTKRNVEDLAQHLISLTRLCNDVDVLKTAKGLIQSAISVIEAISK